MLLFLIFNFIPWTVGDALLHPFTIHVGPQEESCFYEQISAGTKEIAFYFEVSVC